VIIQRLNSPSDRTNGILTLPDGTEFKTLERAWADNTPNISCIPAGHYKFKRDTHGRFQWFRVLEVPDRSAIEFHEGTKPSHSQGCILVSHDALTAMLWFYSDTELTYVLEIRKP